MIRSFALTALAVGCLLAPSADAQIAGPGLQWLGSSGNAAGDFVFNCTPHAVAIVPGETVSINVWGDLFAPFWLLSAPSASQCTIFSGVANALVLDSPVSIASSGFLTLTSPCFSCPPGQVQLIATVPVSVPVGTTISIQALTFMFGVPAFTATITGAV